MKLLDVLSKALKITSKVIADPNAVKILSFHREQNTLTDKDLKDLLLYAYINKVSSLLLKRPINDLLAKLRLKLLQQRRNFLIHLKHVVEMLDKSGTDYVVFKTLRPVPETPVDIDVLVRSKDDVYRAVAYLRKRFSVKVWDEDRYSIGIRIPELSEFIDFYVKPHVADFVYLDSDALIDNRVYMHVNELGIEVLVPIPKPELEFCTILAHSIVKEGLVTLNDVLSLITYELLSSRDELAKLLREFSLGITYRVFVEALRKPFPVRISYSDRSKVLASLLRKRYAASSLPYPMLSLGRRLKRAVEQRKKVTYVRGLEK